MPSHRTLIRRLAATVTTGALLAAAASASAMTLEVVNQSGLPDDQVFVTLDTGPGLTPAFPPELPENTPVPVSSLPAQIAVTETFPSGILLVSYGNGVEQNSADPASSNDPNVSTTRYGFVEFTAPGVADNTYIDQYGVPTRIDTFASGGSPIATRAPVCDTDSITYQLGQIPGAVVKTGAAGHFLRVVGPSKLGESGFPQTYPSLDQYVASLEGQTLSVTTSFSGTPASVATYSGIVSGGSITLNGTLSNPPGPGDPITIPLSTDNIYRAAGPYTQGSTVVNGVNNDVYGQIYNRVISGFGLGYWGGRYGNSVDDRAGSATPGWWGQPAFAEARTSPAPFPAYSEYAAVIAKTAQAYGFPFSDSLPFDPQAGLPAGATLRVTILPDAFADDATLCPTAPTPAPAPAPAPAPPAAPTTGDPVCGPTPRREAGKKDAITLSERALRIQQRIDAAALRRLNAVNDWIDAGLAPGDLCAGAFGPSAFQAGITWVGGGPSVAQTAPTPRPLRIPKAKGGKADFAVTLRQVRINERISKALVARARATWTRINTLTGGNLAPGTSLAGRPLFPGLAVSGALPAATDAPAAPLRIAKPGKLGKIRLDAKQLRTTQRQSQSAIRLANRVTDLIGAGLTEQQFAPGSIGANRLS